MSSKLFFKTGAGISPSIAEVSSDLEFEILGVARDDRLDYMVNKYTAWLSPFDVTAYNSYYECKAKTDASLRKINIGQQGL